MFYTESTHDRYWEYEIFYHYKDEAPQFNSDEGVFIWWESQISNAWAVHPANKTGDTKFEYVNPFYLKGGRQYFWSIVDGEFMDIDDNQLHITVNLEGA